MKLKASSNSDFEPHPEADCIGVLVDITPLKTVESSYGPRAVFRLVFETTVLRDDGRPNLVWSRSFTPSLHEKSAFRSFVKQWFGRDLTAKELAEFDTEVLLGRTAKLSIIHNEYNGSTYANIGLIRPDRSPSPLKASGKYIRIQDRDQSQDEQYRRASNESGKDSGDWRRVKVHVGKHTGIDLGDLDEASVRALIERWLPDAMSNPKPLKADRELIGALHEAAELLGIELEEEDNEPF